MNVRAFILIRVAQCALCIVPTLGAAAGLTVTDPCAKSLSGTATSTSPDPVSVDSSGNIGVVGFTSGTYAAGVGQCDALPADGKPVCTLSASATRLAKGASATLYARCSASTNQYTWNAPPDGPVPSPNPGTTNSVSLNFPNAGAYTYSVAGTSSAGPTGLVSTPITILVGDASDVPTCVLTISPVSIDQGKTANARVVCHPEAATLTWDAAEPGAPAPAAGASAATLLFGGAGTFTYKVLGAKSTGELGPKASATITVKVVPGSCTPGPVTVDYSANPFVAGSYSGDVTFYQGWVVTWSFTAPATGIADFYGNFNSYYWPMPPSELWSISRCKGDFPAGPCTAALGSNYPGTSATTYQGYPPQYYCVITPGVTYYLNIKAVTCPSPPCGMGILRMH